MPTMSLSTTSSPRLLVLLSIFMSFSRGINVVASAPSSPSLIQQVCTHPQPNFNPKFCIQILQSDNRIVSSARNFYDMSIAIMNAGLSNSTATYTYIDSMSRKPNLGLNMKAMLQQCKTSYDLIMKSFRSALSEVKDMEYETATYDLKISSTDYLKQCLDAMAGKKISDATILNANKVVPIYGLSAFAALEELEKHADIVNLNL